MGNRTQVKTPGGIDGGRSVLRAMHRCGFGMCLLALFVLASGLITSELVAQGSLLQRKPAATESAPNPYADSEERPTTEQAVKRALNIVQRIAHGEEDGTWDELTARLDYYISVIQSDDPSNPWLSYLYGWIYAIGGRKGDAIEEVAKFVETREGRNEWLAYRLLGDLFVEQFPRLAKSHYNKAAALTSNEASVLYGLSRCAAATGNTEESIKLAQEAVDADGRKQVRYLTHLARMLMRDRRWSDAERAVRAGLDRAETLRRDQPASDRPLKLLDIQYQTLAEIARARLGESPTAEDYARLADYTQRRAEIGLLLARFETLRLLEQAMKELGGPSPALLERYAVLLAELGREEEAVAAMEELRALDPGNAVAAEWLGRLKPPSPPNGSEP
jgi:tetratricopeptide (TPR) repeat protein